MSRLLSCVVLMLGLLSGLLATPFAEAATPMVAAGYGHTCALTATGVMQCWGINHAGQLGNGTFTDATTPVAVSGLDSGVVAIAAGDSHTCALTATGAVQCWGGFPTYTTTPVAVSGLTSGVVALAAGSLHTCAVTSGGAVQCWGLNHYSQLGDGTTTDATTPVAVSGLGSGVVSLAAGFGHTCALTSSGGVQCWGANWSGQLGNGTSTDATTPVAVSGLDSGVIAIAAGESHTCALTSSGAVQCWGRNTEGRLGDGTGVQSTTPVAVSGLGSGVIAIAAASGNHTCALTSGGAVQCWGWNYYGQIGNGTTTDATTPVAVSGLDSGVIAIAAGQVHTCALTSGRVVQCWGYNGWGQLGNGTTTDATTPVASGFSFTPVAQTISFGALANWPLGSAPFTVSATASSGLPVSFSSTTPAVCTVSGSTVTLLAVGTCTIAANQAGDVTYTAATQVTQSFFVSLVQTINFPAIGNQTLGSAAFTPPVSASSGLPVTLSSNSPAVCSVSGNTVTLLAAGTCTITANQAGDVTYTAATQVTQSFFVFLSVAAGGRHTCALTATGAVQCWGANDAGQLGNGTTNNAITPVGVSGLTSGVVAIAAGDSHTCALTGSGAVQCWGGNSEGQLGNGSTTAATTPVAVSGLTSGVVALAAGSVHTCALISGGAVKCWGWNNYGQLGNGTTTAATTPVAVSGLDSGIVAMDASHGHTCALTGSGAVQCWGFNGYGQLGNGTFTDATTPVAVSGLGSGIAAIAAGDSHTCALTGSGAVQCWGANWSGQLGNGTTTDATTPVAVSGLGSGIAAVAAGSYHTCALTGSGAVQCWGFNGYGQLGNGTTTAATTPVAVSDLGSGIAAVAAGSYHTCAPTSDGAVQCWGANWSGQLGNGTTTDATTPVAVSGFTTPAAQTISFGSLQDRTLGSSVFEPVATASSGLPVTFTSATPGVCTISGSMVTLLATGTCTIAAHQAGDVTYTAASQVLQSFTVLPNNTAPGNNVSVMPVDPTTGTQVATITFGTVSTAGETTVTSGTVPSPPAFVADCTPPVALEIATTATFTGTVTVCVTPAQLGSSCAANALLWHYTGGAWQQLPVPANPPAGQVCGITSSFSPFAVFALSQMAQTITFPSIGTQTLGSTAFMPAVSSNSGLPVALSSNSPEVCSVSGNTVTLLAVGTCAIEASQAGDASYEAATPLIQIFEVVSGSTGGGESDGDVPLPPWALLSLAAALLGAMGRQRSVG